MLFPTSINFKTVSELPTTNSPPQHGGQLLAVSERYQIPLANWLDLSTGINPDMYPIPTIPETVYQHLPEVNEPEFVAAIKDYYGCQQAVVASGSQRFIEALPRLRSASRVALPDVGYQEHAYHWQQQGHEIIFYDGFNPQAVDKLIESDQIDVLVLINPCNPTTACVAIDHLHQWRESLAKGGGWLVIDEAFMDTTPEHSFAAFSHLPGVIVLRSLGKFFGLAGIRIGFAMAEQALCEKLSQLVGPWAIAGPSQFIATKALQDKAWQRANKQQLQKNSAWMVNVLRQGLREKAEHIYAAQLFVSVLVEDKTAQRIVEKLAQAGILIRYWPLPAGHSGQALLRFGLISENDAEYQERLQRALSIINNL